MSVKSTQLLNVFTLSTLLLLTACQWLPSMNAQSVTPSPSVSAETAGGASRSGGTDILLVAMIGLGVTGVVLLVVAALFLLRRRRRSEKGTPVPSASRTAVTLPDILPERTLLNNGQYQVLQAHPVEDAYNVYAVRGTTPLTLCPRCQTKLAGDGSRFCAHCGADLRDMTLVYPKFVARETTDAQAFIEASEVVALRLHHPNVILPEDVFMETAFGPVRYYRVEPAFKSAARLSAPQLPEKVLGWGISLAQGMAYLHDHYVALRHVDLERIVVDNSRARILGVENVYIIPQQAYAQAPAYFTKNVQALGQLLLTLLKGPAQSTADVEVPEEITALLVRAQQPGLTTREFIEMLEGELYKLRMPEHLCFDVGQLTDVGQLRSLNEDNLFVMNLSMQFESLGMPVGVFAVADGMGGHAAGDVASQLTVRAVAQQAEGLKALGAGGTLPDADIWLDQAMTMANHAIYAQRAATDSDMGCTLVLAIVIGGKATIANIGDSRAYQLTPDGITQITTDHSLVERLVAVGQITPEEARVHPQKNIIYRVVGDKAKPEFDIFEQILLPGEALLLCSDGLSGMLTDEHIWELWQSSSSAQAACAHMVSEANRAGGTDNISVVIVQMRADIAQL